ncbi:uncharacterized protein METZ01_LOCUS313443, partial [marine metagenome]
RSSNSWVAFRVAWGTVGPATWRNYGRRRRSCGSHQVACANPTLTMSRSLARHPTTTC